MKKRLTKNLKFLRKVLRQTSRVARIANQVEDHVILQNRVGVKII